MEVNWISKRVELWRLCRQSPTLSNRQLAKQIEMSPSWVKKWKKRLRDADGTDLRPFMSRSRRRKASPKRVTEVVEAKILHLRDHLTEHYQRRVGATNILYHLHHDDDLKRLNVYLPKSPTTVHDVLVRYHRIQRPGPRIHVPREPAEPLQVWEIDFSDVVTAQSETTDKRQHQVDVFDVIDTGSSLALETKVSEQFDAKHGLITMIDVLLSVGCPRVIRFDRDPRFVASWSVDKFPSAFIRFLLCVGITPDICPARRPDLKPYVERFIRTQKEECIYPKRPSTVTQAQILISQHAQFYNLERPNQAVTCNNLPPSTAIGEVPRLPRLPEKVDPDVWLAHYHKHDFRRTVPSNGSVTVDKYMYYVGKAFIAQKVILRLDAKTRQFDIYCQNKLVKKKPIQGLYHGMMPFGDYVELMMHEAQSEEKRLKAKRRLRRVTG